MLSKLPSYVLIAVLLLIDFVSSRKFKCIDENCSVSIAKAKAKISYPGKSNNEMNVRAGQNLQIYGTDVDGEYHLVKIRDDDELRLLPKNVLREDSNVQSKASVLVENPFRKTLSACAPPVEEKCSVIEEFRAFIRGLSTSAMNNVISYEKHPNGTNALTENVEKDQSGNNVEETEFKIHRNSSNPENDSHISENDSHVPENLNSFRTNGIESNTSTLVQRKPVDINATALGIISSSTQASITSNISKLSDANSTIDKTIREFPTEQNTSDTFHSLNAVLPKTTTDQKNDTEQDFDANVTASSNTGIQEINPQTKMDAFIASSSYSDDSASKNLTSNQMDHAVNDTNDSSSVMNGTSPNSESVKKQEVNADYNINNTTSKQNETIRHMSEDNSTQSVSPSAGTDFSNVSRRSFDSSEKITESDEDKDLNQTNSEMPNEDGLWNSSDTAFAAEAKKPLSSIPEVDDVTDPMDSNTETQEEKLLGVSSVGETPVKAKNLVTSMSGNNLEGNTLPESGQLHITLKKDSQSFQNPPLVEESKYYSTMLDYVDNLPSLFGNFSSLRSYLNFEWLQKSNTSAANGYCESESCSGSVSNSLTENEFDIKTLDLLQLWRFLSLERFQTACLVVGIVICVLLLSITLFSILLNSKKKHRIDSLIGLVNQLEKKLFVATKEISLLEEKFSDTPSSQANQLTAEINHGTCKELLKQQIELLQLQNTDLEDKVSYLEKELESVSTSALEIHKLLENSLSTQAHSQLAEEDVEALRTLSERQERQIDELMKEMDSVITENRCLKDDFKKVEKECNAHSKRNLELSERNRNLSLRLDRQIEETASLKNNYKSEVYLLQSKIEDLEISLRRSEFQVEELNRAFLDKHRNKSDDQIEALQDGVQLRLQLSTLKAMNKELSAELKEQKNARRTLDDHIGDVIKECNELKQALEASERGRNEAVNKLQVLSDYFNEKETQLQKEISAKEKLFLENESKDQLVSQKLSSLKEEIINCKERNEELKKELFAQEVSFKNQLATAEQKSRDLWFALRQAERKYQESEREAAALRNKILILETNLSSLNQKLSEKSSTNGDLDGSQSMMYVADMLPYRITGEFVPPLPTPVATSHSAEYFPPEPSFSPDERLPPLGGRRGPSPSALLVPPPPDDDDLKPPIPHAQYLSARNRHELAPPPPVPSYYADNVQYSSYE